MDEETPQELSIVTADFYGRLRRWPESVSRDQAPGPMRVRAAAEITSRAGYS
jgi:hypothetical protein